MAFAHGPFCFFGAVGTAGGFGLAGPTLGLSFALGAAGLRAWDGSRHEIPSTGQHQSPIHRHDVEYSTRRAADRIELRHT